MKRIRTLGCMAFALFAALAVSRTASAQFDYCNRPYISPDLVARTTCLGMHDVTATSTNQECSDKFNECRKYFREKLDATLDYYSQAQFGVFTAAAENSVSGPSPYKVEDKDKCRNAVHGEFLGSGDYHDKHQNPAKQSLVADGFEKFKAELPEACDPEKMKAAAVPAAGAPPTAPTAEDKSAVAEAPIPASAAAPAQGGCSLASNGGGHGMAAWLLILAWPLLQRKKRD